MRRDAAIAAIVDLTRQGAGFRADAAAIAARIAAPNRATLIESLLECGTIPESFEHDSTEEKLYAKYCDALLAHAFTAMGMESAVIEERGDSADVLGRCKGYSIVGDAKAFRLSRTATNPKDFKVTALSGWRGDNTYALLVCPIYQYPAKRSQIYDHATSHNVTMLGYVHVAFLVEHAANADADLPLVWNVGATMERSRKATQYWRRIDEIVCQVANRPAGDLETFKKRERAVLDAVKRIEVAHLEGEIEAAMKLTREEAIQRLIAEMNTASRINQIKSMTY